jgi:hypothetical protein
MMRIKGNELSILFGLSKLGGIIFFAKVVRISLGFKPSPPISEKSLSLFPSILVYNRKYE